MNIENSYLSAFTEMDKLIKYRTDHHQYSAMGYTSNLDLLCNFNVEILNVLLEKYLPDAQLFDLKTAPKITTVEELLAAMVFFCTRGIGGEADIENIELMESYFQWEYGIGGTAAQAAMAQAAIGCPSIIHLTDDSKRVCAILDSPHIYTVSREGKLIHTGAVVQKNEQEIHFIIQFKKGDVIRLGHQEIRIPCSNRLIMTKITVNEFVPFSVNYFKYIEQNARIITSNVLSSFNALVDETLLIEHLEFVKQHIGRYKKGNPSGIVFFEDAHYHNVNVRKRCLETIYSQVDIVSLNEEELEYTLNMYDVPVRMEEVYSCIEGARYIKDKFGVQKGIIVHTKDYSMYVGSTLGLNIEKGLIYGNLLATAKAKHGTYGTREQIAQLLQLPLSEKGIAFREQIILREDTKDVVIVPTKYMDKPQYTIGLGDSFVAGVQMCFN